MQKHKATESKFKPTVRIFKNMRNRMIKDGTLQEGIAPSYFLEGMLYNVPNEHFTGTYNDIFVACFNWIFPAERDKLVCANGLHWLVREEVHTSWSSANMTKFLDGARKLWNDWGN